jgi:hypothetical protein
MRNNDSSDRKTPQMQRCRLLSLMAKKEEHPCECPLIVLWKKIFKVYSFAGQLKTV